MDPLADEELEITVSHRRDDDFWTASVRHKPSGVRVFVSADTAKQAVAAAKDELIGLLEVLGGG